MHKKILSKLKVLIVFLLSAALPSTLTFAQDSAKGAGQIQGRVFDNETNEPLEKVTIVIDSTEQTVLSDAEGKFALLDVAPGVYSLTLIKGGYQVSSVEDVKVTEGQALGLSLPMKRYAASDDDNIFEMDEFIVKADVIEGSRAGLDLLRKRSAASINALSSDDISRFGAKDAAEALTRVAGVSITDGKFAVIRGLGDRYTSTTLNGATLPSADPDRQAVQLDLFSSNLLETIITSKTFTPDQPGNSTGGSIQLQTKRFPEERILSAEVGIGYNSAATGNSDFLTYNGTSWKDKYTFWS